MKAQHISEIYNAFQPGALQGAALEEFYVETDEARDDRNTIEIIIDKIKSLQGYQYARMLFYGYKGSGKSTMLNKMSKKVESDYLTINFSVRTDLNETNLGATDLIIKSMQQLFEAARDRDLRVSAQLLDDIQNWSGFEKIKKSYSDEKSFKTDLEGEGGFNVPFFAKLLAKVTAGIKYGHTTERVFEQVHSPEVTRLVELCNALMIEVRQELHRVKREVDSNAPNDLLFVIEDLDKIDVARSERIFDEQAAPLSGLRAHFIYTYPIALRYHHKFNNIHRNFTDLVSLPMIKTRNRDGSLNALGYKLLMEIVDRRMELNLFEKQEILHLMIDKSGGCLQDFFRMISDAGLTCGTKKLSVITEKEALASIQRVRNDYNSTIADKTDDEGTVLIKASEYWEELRRAATDPNKEPDNTSALLDLRHSLCVLEYNTENWCDVHPLVRDNLIRRGLIPN